MPDDFESQAYEEQEATFGRVIRPVDCVIAKKTFFVTTTGQVYKEKSHEWEKPAEVDFSGQKRELVELGNIDPEDIRKQIRRFVYGQIGDVAPYNVITETGETWDDFVMYI